MRLLYKPNGTPYDIYDITYDKNGYPKFLFYRNGQWLIESAKHFTPDFYEDGIGTYLYTDNKFTSGSCE